MPDEPAPGTGTTVDLRYDDHFRDRVGDDDHFRDRVGGDDHEDPVSELLVCVDGTWVSGDGVYLRGLAFGTFVTLLDRLVRLYEGSERESFATADEPYLALYREGEELTVAERYSEAAVADPEALTGAERSGTTGLDEFAAAALAGAERLLDRARECGVPGDHEDVRRLRAAMDELAARLDDGHHDR